MATASDQDVDIAYDETQDVSLVVWQRYEGGQFSIEVVGDFRCAGH